MVNIVPLLNCSAIFKSNVTETKALTPFLSSVEEPQ
mgnify:CR=1 FL=1